MILSMFPVLVVSYCRVMPGIVALNIIFQAIIIYHVEFLLSFVITHLDFSLEIEFMLAKFVIHVIGKTGMLNIE